MADDPVLEFLMQWVLEFGTDQDYTRRHQCSWYQDASLGVYQKPLDLYVTPIGGATDWPSKRSCAINQAGLDYIKNGHGQLSTSEDKEN